MASSLERSISGRSSISNRSTPLMPGRVVVAYDATKNHANQVFDDIISNIRKQGGMIQEGDTITMLGVLHKVPHPMGFHIQIGSNSFFGTHARAIMEDSSRKLNAYVSMLQNSAAECRGNGINIEVKIAVGASVKKVVLQEVVASNAAWVVLDRHLKKESRYYLKHMTCKVALVLENLSLDVLRSHDSDKVHGATKHKLVYALSKPVSPLPTEDIENNEQSVISSTDPEIVNHMDGLVIQQRILENSLSCNSKKPDFSMQEEFVSNPQEEKSRTKDSDTEGITECTDTAILGTTSNEVELGLGSMRYSYNQIKIATNDFSTDNLLDEGGHGVVYTGQLENGQRITAKVQKEASTQGIPEFLRFACHKNIEMFLGYCCSEDLNILLYEYICNNSLEWHLLGNTESVLDWHQRHSISIGIAKGLRYLHEECRGSPIIHGCLRPCNVFLKHDFVPLLINCGLANSKTSKDDRSRTTHGTINAYLAPECEVNGTFSVKTDVYALGIVLLQLISGRPYETVELLTSNNHQPLLQWALPLIQMLAVDELVDPRLGDSYSIYELYNMASVAYLCIQTEPMNRPSIGEVLRSLEGKSAHLQHLTGQMKHDIA